MPPRKQKLQQPPTAGESLKKPKVTHQSEGKGKPRAASAPPDRDVQEVAIMDLRTLGQTVAHFSLKHHVTHPPLIVDRARNPFSWPITDAMVEGWLWGQLGPEIVREIDLVMGNGSAIHEFIFNSRCCAPGDIYDSGRPIVDLTLVAATAIANGSGSFYRNEGARTWQSQMGLKGLKLMFEVPVVFDDEVMGRQYSGRIDMALGTVEQNALGKGGDTKDISTEVGYRTLLAVVEAKGQDTYRVAEAQLLAYMGCLYRNREAKGTREDSSAFGAITNGTAWRFFMLDQQGATGGADNQRAHVPVRESRQYEVHNRAELRVVLAMIIYILRRGVALLTPHGLPVQGDDDGTIVVRK